MDMNYNERKRWLTSIYAQTVDAVMKGQYTCDSGKTVVLDDDSEMRNSSRMFSKEFSVREIKFHEQPTKIVVINQDSINAGLVLKDEGYNPIVLNFANRFTAGGGVLNGARAQEETIFRRTNLFRSLYQFMPFAEEFGLLRRPQQYPMERNFGGIYSPNVTVIRDTEYNFIENPLTISFVSVAAINRPFLVGDRIAPEFIEGTVNKIRTILRIGLQNGHDAIVLGAFGCGAFRNPPRHIAELFKAVINEEEFKNKYRKIVFAILEDHNSIKETSREENLKAFTEVFQGGWEGKRGEGLWRGRGRLSRGGRALAWRGRSRARGRIVQGLRLYRCTMSAVSFFVFAPKDGGRRRDRRSVPRVSLS